MSGWNEKKLVNPSSADLAHTTPNVTHVAHINSIVAHIAPDVAQVAHVLPHEAQETSVLMPYVNNVMSVITPETPQEKFLSSDVLHELRQIPALRLKVLLKMENTFTFRHLLLKRSYGFIQDGRCTRIIRTRF